MQGEGICLLIALELTALELNFKDCSSLTVLPAHAHLSSPVPPFYFLTGFSCNFLFSAVPLPAHTGVWWFAIWQHTHAEHLGRYLNHTCLRLIPDLVPLAPLIRGSRLVSPEHA